MDLDIRQKKVVESEAQNILCLASAGSGKTRVLTERIRYLITQKGVSPSKIVAITFTNMAADEMRKRLSDISQGLWIGTIHAYANYLCLKNGLDTQSYIDNHKFDKIIEKANTIRKTSSFDEVEHLLVDECQDISELEYNFLCRIPAKNCFYVGDERQAIYGFKGCSCEYLEAMANDPNFKVYFLNQNYRNAPNIIKEANSYLYSFDPISPTPVAVKTRNGIVDHCSFMEAFEELQESGNWGLWFILARTNLEVDTIMDILEAANIPCVTFKKGDLNEMELEEVLAENRVKVLTIHSSKGLECKRAIMCGARTYNEEERKIAYVGATRPENALYICPSVKRRKRKDNPLSNRTAAGDTFGKTSQKMIKF